MRTSLVLVSRKRARVRLASPSMFMVPMKLVLIVLIGLYLAPQQTTQEAQQQVHLAIQLLPASNSKHSVATEKHA